MIIIHGVNGKSARFANERRLSPSARDVRQATEFGVDAGGTGFDFPAGGFDRYCVIWIEDCRGGWVLGGCGSTRSPFDKLRAGPSASSGQAHHERVGGLVDDGEDGGLGVTGRTGCGRGSSAGVVELDGVARCAWDGWVNCWVPGCGRRGCGSTRPAGDSGPAHHERLDAPHVGGCTLNSRAAQAVVVSRAGLKGWMG